jgi:hypothetical protein
MLAFEDLRPENLVLSNNVWPAASGDSLLWDTRRTCTNNGRLFQEHVEVLLLSYWHAMRRPPEPVITSLLILAENCASRRSVLCMLLMSRVAPTAEEAFIERVA